MPWGNAGQSSANFLTHLNKRHNFEYDRFVVIIYFTCTYEEEKKLIPSFKNNPKGLKRRRRHFFKKSSARISNSNVNMCKK